MDETRSEAEGLRQHRNAAFSGRDVRVRERLLQTEQRDSGPVEAERLGDAPVGEGTQIHFLGRQAALSYRVVEFEPGKAVTLRGENATGVSLDRITFERPMGHAGHLRCRPPLSGRSLDKRQHNLPGDLREQHTFIVAAFRREQPAD